MSGLDDMIASLRGLADMPKKIAAAAAPAVQAVARATAAAGTDPEGRAWAPRKKDGGRPLANAAAAISTKALGSLLITTLAGVEVFHHYSTAYPRRIIPDGGAGIPEPIAKVILAAASDIFARATGGR